ncbi:hypothetical protein BCR42DRAFT_455723 [Absidia repens]|uniref:Myb-like domain-containing protein n=1 Tax=Absidia repens TaxID=90262 RepID=A0A1X2I368_9FUNG|nr:hypothetical protein BCR42DRAFT_455723 [Absidia repens]
MFTSPFANKHFDFNSQYIQLPMIHPMMMTVTTQEDEDITMTEAAAPAAGDHATTTDELLPWNMDYDGSLLKAAHTLLTLHYATFQGDDDDEASVRTSTTISSSHSSLPSSSSSSSTTSSSSSIDYSNHEAEEEDIPSRRTRRQYQTTAITSTSPSTASTSIIRGSVSGMGNSTVGATAKPRWSDEERTKLLMAVIEEKTLDQLTTFDWQRVAAGVKNQNRTTCRDRWRDDLLPVILQLYQTTTSPSPSILSLAPSSSSSSTSSSS